jgi:glycosyltransferase involved in cell wall biosynthesis
VIIPTYNNSRYIKKTIESVLRQTFRDFEIIVVDDGSTDNTAVVLEEYKGEITYFHQHNRGASSARNKGINEARGKYISFLDSDDYYCEDNLLKKINILESNPYVGLVYSDWNYVNEQGNFIEKGSYRFLHDEKKTSGYIFEELLYKRNFITTSAVLVRKIVLDDVGLFDPMIPSQEEYDLWLRICSKYAVHYIDKPLVNQIVHRGSLSTDFSKWALGNALIVDKIDKIVPKDFAVKNGFIKRLKSDKFTFLARDHTQNNQFKNAWNAYMSAIKILPIQKRIYWLLVLFFFRLGKYYLNPNILKKNIV